MFLGMGKVDMKIEIVENSNGISYDVLLDTKVCFLYGDSGTGKTYLLSKIMAYAMRNNISYVHFNYDAINMKQTLIIDSCIDKVLLDNADLYASISLLRLIEDKCKMLVVCMHSVMTDIFFKDRATYEVVFNHASLSTKKWSF